MQVLHRHSVFIVQIMDCGKVFIVMTTGNIGVNPERKRYLRTSGKRGLPVKKFSKWRYSRSLPVI